MVTILFVEDEQRGVNSYFRHLEKHGFRCVLAQNGDQAIRKLRTQKFDLLSLDVMFDPGKTILRDSDPRRAGLLLLEHIRQNKIPHCDPHLKVIVLTAVANPQIEEKIKNLGVTEYLKKPIAFEKVIAAIQKAKGSVPMSSESHPQTDN
ncbi:MAG: response regulator [bacterium]